MTSKEFKQIILEAKYFTKYEPILEKDTLEYCPMRAEWTAKAYKSYFGVAHGMNQYTKDVNKDKSKIKEF